MKILAFLAFLALGATSVAASESVLPQPYEKERYQSTRVASPFVLATKAPPVINQTPATPFTQNLFVVGLGRVDGKEYVSIVRLGEEKNPIRLWGSNPNEDGLAVQQIAWSAAFGKSKVTLRKGAETGEIGFNENAVKTPPIVNNVKQPPTGPGVKHPDRIRVIQ